MVKTIVILPTYNEAENICPMVEAIFAQIPSTQILIVDDNSPDGTGKIADNLAKNKPEQVFVLHRPKKEGLGKAYLEAFHQVLKMNVDQIIQMDTDFSHPPSLLPKLLEALRQYDFVLGCRYIKGGGTQNWSFKRRLLSRMGNLYAKTVLNLPIHDLTGGFKAFNRRVIEHLVTCPIDSQGYNFQIETTARALAAGFKCVEIPFVFIERENGTSKMSRGVVWEAVVKTFRLRKLSHL